MTDDLSAKLAVLTEARPEPVDPAAPIRLRIKSRSAPPPGLAAVVVATAAATAAVLATGRSLGPSARPATNPASPDSAPRSRCRHPRQLPAHRAAPTRQCHPDR